MKDEQTPHNYLLCFKGNGMLELKLKNSGETIAPHRAIVQAKFSELEPFDSAPLSEPLSNISKSNLDSIILQFTDKG